MANVDTHRDAEGLWQFTRSVPVADDGGRQVNNIVTFSYRDGMVTLRLLTLHPGQWKSKDDFYKLSARWQGDTLLYLPPFGDWTELASFEDARFVNIGNGIKRIFEKISDQDVVDWNKAITAPRQPHDYRLKPDGSLKP